jgi:hypothetical protein
MHPIIIEIIIAWQRLSHHPTRVLIQDRVRFSRSTIGFALCATPLDRYESVEPRVLYIECRNEIDI